MRVVAGFSPSLVFERPLELWAPRSMRDALRDLRQAQDALARGRWLAGAFSYEFGAALHGIAARDDADQPLFLIGAFEAPQGIDRIQARGSFSMTAPLASVPYGVYAQNVNALRERIRDGEVYQVNYTLPFEIAFSGSALDLWLSLSERAHAPYAAFLEHEATRIASISPELFLRFDGSRVTAKPMKGTASLDAIGELDNEKNRSEHLMIADLLRNDLNRICEHVRVERLFEVEHYPTFATMTATISGTLRTRDFAEILQAMFPCGSVTGAPKRAAMQHIRQAERRSRGFYTGSMGFLSPDWHGWWNVPIRTLQFEGGRARFDAGGGIVIDSHPDREWNEIAIKSAFLNGAHDDFAILETFASNAPPERLSAHLERLAGSALAFGLRADLAAVRRAAGEPPQLVRVRVDRLGTSIAREPLSIPNLPVRLAIAAERVRSDDAFAQHKTSWRAVYDAALAGAREHGCFEAILLNERGEIAQGARTNIFARIGSTLYTPPLASGALPGILRAELLARGEAFERTLLEDDLLRAQAIYAGNSARGLLPAVMVRK